MMKTVLSFKTKNKGQSFIELALLMSTLLLLVVGLIEFGNMLNQYINLVDGAREGARFASNTDPFLIPIGQPGAGTYDYSGPQPTFFTDIDLIVEGHTNVAKELRTSAITPIFLYDPPEDAPGFRTPSGAAYKRADVLIAFYAVSNGAIVRKWTWNKYGSGQVSQITDAQVTAQLNPAAPSTGIVLVEIFYNYFQLLKLPFLTYVVADPIPVHAYAFMPLASAESTPTPSP